MQQNQQVNLLVEIIVLDFLLLNVLRDINFDLVYPHLNFGVELWDSTKHTLLSSLRNLLHECLRFVEEIFSTMFQEK